MWCVCVCGVCLCVCVVCVCMCLCGVCMSIYVCVVCVYKYIYVCESDQLLLLSNRPCYPFECFSLPIFSFFGADFSPKGLRIRRYLTVVPHDQSDVILTDIPYTNPEMLHSLAHITYLSHFSSPQTLRSASLLQQRCNSVIMSRSAGHPWRHNSKRCTELPAVLCDFYSFYTIQSMGEEMRVYRVLVGKPEGSNHWGDLGLDGWIILGWISRRLDVGVWTGLG